MHGKEFYGWCETDGNKVTPVNSFLEEPLTNAFCSNYYYNSDDSMFYMVTKEITVNKKKVLHSEIKYVEC